MCLISAVLCLFCGCSIGNNAADDAAAPDPIENEMSNREYLSSMLKSWEIFNKAADNADGDPEREPLQSAIIEAAASEAANKRIEITLSCRQDQINEYKRMASYMYDEAVLFIENKKTNYEVSLKMLETMA